MKLKFTLMFLSLMTSTTALAVDVSNCPQEIRTLVEVTRVYKSSQYKSVEGWNEAQENLSSQPAMQLAFAVKSRGNGKCFYEESEFGHKATLSTTEFYDPEENGPSYVTQLVLNLNINESRYVSFIPVKSYSDEAVVLYRDPYQIKIKARLRNSEQKWWNCDMGMVQITAQK